MAQTPCIRVGEGLSLDRTFAANAKAGDVVLVGTKPLIVSHAVTYTVQPVGAVDSRGLWDIPQKGEIITAGDVVYWDPTGDPYVGDSGSGAATATAGSRPLGRAAPMQPNGLTATTATDKYVRVLVENYAASTTVAGSVTADDIAASDATLTIVGLTAAQGGLIGLTGGTSETAANHGGAVTATGGTGGATGNGGAVTITGGTPGATSGTGGAVAIVGGGSAAGTNYTGGAVSVTGGAGKGTGAGGAATLASGAAGATGAGGAVSITSAAGGATSGNGGAINITSGAGTAGNGSGGVIAITAGVKHGSGKDGMIRMVGREATRVTVTAKTTAATLTIAELLTGVLTGTHTAGATQAYTLPTGTLMSAGCACADGDGFEWSLINLSAAAADSITVTAGDDHTIVGNAIVISAHASTGGAITSQGVASSRWYSRKTTGNTWVTYRIG